MGSNNKNSTSAAWDETINGAELVYELRKMIRSYFPDLQQTLSQITDIRKRKDYRSDELISAAAGMFIFKAQSRNAVNNDRRHSGEFTANFQKLFKTNLPHLDSVQDFFEILPPTVLEQVKVKLVSRLLENKIFYWHKIFDCYMVAVDATGMVSSDEDRFGYGLKKESKNGKITCLYPVLEAKLVTENGFCISLATEWIVNDNDKPYDKQDCEQKAFKRLGPKSKKVFPPAHLHTGKCPVRQQPGDGPL